MSELAQQLIEINLLTKAPLLDLGCCGLDGSEEAIFALLAKADHLKTLILSDFHTSYHEINNDFMFIQSVNKGLPNCIRQLPDKLPASLECLFLGDDNLMNDSNPIITNIGALSYLRNLQLLQVHGCNLESNVFVYDLPNLRALGLINIPMQRLYEFWALEHLEYLTFRECYLGQEDVEFLKNFKNLRHLDLSQNYITSLDFLPRLDHLHSLYAERNQLVSLPSHEQLPQVQSLHLQENTIEYCEGLEHFTQLKQLNLGNNILEDIEPVQHLTKLELLALGSNFIFDVSPIGHLLNLTYLDLSESDGDYENLDVLKNLQSLEVLDLHSCTLSSNDILFLKELKSLRGLNLEDNFIDNFELFQHMPRLHMLNLKDNEIESVDDLWVLTNLLWLNISENDVEDIGCLNMLDNLVYLFMSNNQITDIEVVQHLPKLRVVDVDGNHIKDLSPLLGLRELEIVGICPKSVAYLPIAFVLLHCEGGVITDYRKEPELPAIEEIYPLMASLSEDNHEQARQLMDDNHWTLEQRSMYFETVAYHNEITIVTNDNLTELYFARKTEIE